jgi:hypothetical protein
VKIKRLIIIFIILTLLITILVGCGSSDNGGSRETQQLTYYDDFSDISTGWPESVHTDWNCRYINGEYEINIPSRAQYHAYVYDSTGFVNNYTARVNVKNNCFSKMYPVCGIVFNFKDETEFYVFKIFPDDYINSSGYKYLYRIQRWYDNQWNPITEGYSSYIYPSSFTTLEVQVSGSIAQFYIGGHLVETVNNLISHSDGEGVGMFVRSQNYTPISIRFDDFYVSGTAYKKYSSLFSAGIQNQKSFQTSSNED